MGLDELEHRKKIHGLESRQIGAMIAKTYRAEVHAASTVNYRNIPEGYRSALALLPISKSPTTYWSWDYSEFVMILLARQQVGPATTLMASGISAWWMETKLG